jgi:hypothetical protein
VPLAPLEAFQELLELAWAFRLHRHLDSSA